MRTRSTSTTPPVAGTGNITVAARDDGGARSLWASALTAGGSAAKVSGQTKTEVKDKLQLLHDELREGVRSSPKYTVQNAVEDWLAQALDGRAAKTISTNREGPRTLDRADRGCEAQGTHGGGSQVGSGAACNHSFYQSRADDPQQPCPGHPLCRGE